MKVIQLLARIEGSGVTRYVIEFNKGLNALGIDNEILAFKTGFKDADISNTQSIPNAEFVDFSDETLSRINVADLVIINSIIDRRAETRDIWIDFVQHRITTFKVIVVNDHKTAGFRAYYGDLLKRPDFWASFNKICIFSYDSKVYQEIRKLIGEEGAQFRFMHLMHPYTFSDNHLWKDPSKMVRRVCYLGRHAPFKDNCRLIRGKQTFINHGYELEMRGIKRTINAAGTPNLVYKYDESIQDFVLDENGKKLPSDDTLFISNKWYKDNNVSKDDPLVFDKGRDKSKVYIFDAYKRDEGLEIISNYPYVADFYHLDDDNCYGDNLEYVVFETIDSGSIPLLDWNAGNACHIYADGKDTGKTFLQEGIGMFLKKDLSNAEECLNRMDEVFADPEKYKQLRVKVLDVIKKHTDPKSVVKTFIDQCN